MKLKIEIKFRAAIHFISNSVHSVSSVVKPSSSSSDSGSALVLVLLITALLATVAVSFLSTSRIEQIAAKNFTRQNAASGLAEMATQQAMAKIQQGFTVTGNGTTVITTQPGAIWQHTFSSGTCNAVSGKNPVELFSNNGTINANLNNLQNPSSNSSASSNRWTITGNASEQINVPMENITSNGAIVGRIAYYVDDEGSKLNVNNAVGNRTALNAALRPLDIAALSANYTNIFASIVNGAGPSNTSNVTTWSHFFRPDQVGAAINSAGGNFSTENLPYITTATSSTNSAANITHLLTPWGTQRIDINTLSTNAADGTGDASVRSIFEAFTGLNGTTMNATSNSTYVLTGRGLQNVFGGNFATKYTPIGVKQIAANMLQMRDPNTATVNASFSYQGPLLGSASLNSSTYLPEEYLGFAPYPVVNEVSFDVTYGARVNDPTSTILRPVVFANVELYNPYPVAFIAPNATLECFMRGLTWNMTHTNISTAQSFTYRYGGYGNWTDSTSSPEYFQNSNLRDSVAPTAKFKERYFLTDNPFGVHGLYIPPYSKKKYQFTSSTPWGAYGQAWITSSSNTRITISNLECAITYVKIVANSTIAGGLNGSANINANLIRDWVSGADVGRFIPNNGTLSPRHTDPVALPVIPTAVKYPDSASPISTYSYQRLCPLIKTSMAASSNLTDSTRSWTVNASSANQTFGNITSGSNLTTTDSTEALNDANANPLYDSGNTIPSDPSYNNLNGNAIYANATQSSDMRVPELPSFSGNYFYTSPADLGLVPTNQRWRRLRMQVQPAIEGARIPDWAILNVISFGNSSNSNLPYNRFQPVNINAIKFHLSGNASVAPRTIGIQSLVNGLAANGEIQNPMELTQTTPVDVTRFKGSTPNGTDIANIVNAIRDMTWSSSSSWDTRRNALRFPSDQYILPSEIIEIAGVADAVDAVSPAAYNNSTSHFKWNEGRASAIIPAVTTRSSFFTIYAYAQAGQLQDKNQPESASNPFIIDSEALTRTLVEVEVETPATATDPAVYKVKKLYTQPILLGQ